MVHDAAIGVHGLEYTPMVDSLFESISTRKFGEEALHVR